jgi:hypothetical protein
LIAKSAEASWQDLYLLLEGLDGNKAVATLMAHSPAVRTLNESGKGSFSNDFCDATLRRYASHWRRGPLLDFSMVHVLVGLSLHMSCLSGLTKSAVTMLS